VEFGPITSAIMVVYYGYANMDAYRYDTMGVKPKEGMRRE